MSSCEDIKPKWLSVARRLQEFSSHESGRSKFVSIKIAVDSENNPIFWYRPKMDPIEPKLTKDQLLTLLAGMTDDEQPEI